LKDFNDHIISDNRSVVDALTQINQLSGNLNLTLFVCDSQGKMLGTLTDGDFRRGFMKGLKLDDSIDSFMVKNFRHFTLNDINVAHIKELRAKQIKLVPLLDEDGRIIKVYDFTQRKTILPVDAVLMAGGRGERLRPLTDTTPKPMLLIGNKPIIEHNIDNLTTNGIDNFFVTVNYLADQIVNHLGNGEKKGIRIECVKETKPLGTIGSVSLIKNFNNDTVLIMNSDLFTNINFEDFYLDFVEKNAAMSIASVPYQISVPYAVLNQDNETVDSFEEKPTYTYHANAGIYLIKKELLDIIPISTHFNATDFIQALLNSGRKVIKYPIIGYWIDIGKHEDYNKAQEFAKHINSQS
jgi:dTDP-glucose pyrophosphorylase